MTNQIFVIEGPAGAGKSYALQRLEDKGLAHVMSKKEQPRDFAMGSFTPNHEAFLNDMDKIGRAWIAQEFIKIPIMVDSDTAGPWVEGGRWVVCVRRRYTNVVSMLKDNLKEKVENIGVARRLVKDVREAEVYINMEIITFYAVNKEFAKFLTNFIRGKAIWIS